MRLEQTRQLSRRRVNLTPLIDVVFILLMFFMLASDLQQWRALTLNVPATRVTTTPANEEALRLRINANGEILLGDAVLSLDDLAARLRSILMGNPEQTVVVQPHGDVPVQILVDVFDRLTASGVQKLTLGEP